MTAKPLPRPVAENARHRACFWDLPWAPGTIFGLDMLDSSLRYVDQAESFLKLPVLAVVSDLQASVVTKFPVFSPRPARASRPKLSEACARRSRCLGDEEHRRSFLVTSAIPGEGKTFCAYNAAMAFAAEGQKTVLGRCGPAHAGRAQDFF